MKKKIIFINNHFQRSDGTVRALIGLCNNLDPEKFDVTILSMYRCHRELAQELKKGIKLKSAFGFYFRGMSKIVRLIPNKLLYKCFVKDNYDIEVAFQCDAPTRMIGHSTNKNAVHVIWMHGYDKTDYESPGFKADYHITVSKHCAQRLSSEIATEAKIKHCYNLVDDSIILEKAKETIDIVKGKITFITVGRLSPEKGFVRLIKIMHELKEEGYDFNLYIVGDGPERKKMENIISENNMSSFIFLTGSQTNPYKYIIQADVFICSSYSEGYSTVCTEAAILGKPIITTSVPGGKEIIDEAQCGIITDLTDESLKEGIKKVLDNPSLIKEWKKIAKQTSERFKLKSRKETLDCLFDEFSRLSDKKITL